MEYKRMILGSAMQLLMGIAALFFVKYLGWISDWQTCVYIPAFIFVIDVTSKILKKKGSKKYPTLSDADSKELDKVLQ